MLNFTKLLMVAVVGATVGALTAYFWDLSLIDTSSPQVQVEPAEIRTAPEPSIEELYPYVLAPNSTLNSALREIGISAQIIHQIVEGAKPVSDLGRLNAGVRFQLTFQPESPGDLVGLKFRFSPTEKLEVRKTGDTWVAEKTTEIVDIKIRTFSGVVKSSLWESAIDAEMDPNLISELAEVFAWQIDFSRELRENDRWRISVEQKLVRGQPVGWGSILAAEYENGDQKFSGFLFDSGDGQRGYFSPDGANLKKMFLKSPLRYGRISSRFTMKRFHPVLQINRAHLGVDYAAPIGTPVRAVGDGVVSESGWRGAAGNMIRLRHNSIYMTAYKHLKGFARGIRAGARVSQGQVIGYVGTTGLSSGPHLHFEFYQSGRFVDPLSRKFPSAEPIPPALMGQFQIQVRELETSLPPWDKVRIGGLKDDQETY